MALRNNVHKLKVSTYNCKHFYDVGPKYDFINNFSNECDIIFIQEYCLYENQFGKLAKIGGGYGTEAKTSMDKTIARHGSPYGGCAIVWNPRIQGKVDTVLCNHNILCGITVTINDFNLLLLNADMPCDK